MGGWLVLRGSATPQFQGGEVSELPNFGGSLFIATAFNAE